jgi:hypothetical protein
MRCANELESLDIAGWAGATPRIDRRSDRVALKNLSGALVKQRGGIR